MNWCFGVGYWDIVSIHDHRKATFQHGGDASAFTDDPPRRGRDSKVGGSKNIGNILRGQLAEFLKLKGVLILALQLRPQIGTASDASNVNQFYLQLECAQMAEKGFSRPDWMESAEEHESERLLGSGGFCRALSDGSGRQRQCSKKWE